MQRSDMAVIELSAPWEVPFEEEEEDEEEREMEVFMVAGKRCEGKEAGELAFSEGPYETSVDQEKQDGSRSHKDRLADAEVPLTLNVDKAGHLENVNDLQDVLLLGKRRDRRAPVRKAPSPPEAVPYYVDENDFLKACEENKMSLVERYLTRGGDPDACDTFRRTALHKACSRGHVAVTETLLEAGAAIESKDKLEATAVHCACRGGSLPALELLLNRGANFSTRDKLRSTPLHVAVRTGHYDCAQHLVHCGAEVNAKDRDGDTPMHDAVRLNRPKIIQLLLLHGANLNLKNCEGKSPMDSALEWQSGAKNMLSNFKQDGQSQNK